MNEENNRKPKTEKAKVVNEEVNCVSTEAKNALRRMKKGKAVGPNELPIEIPQVHGRDGDKIFDQTVQQTMWVNGCQKNGDGVCLSQSIKTKGTHSAVESTEE